MPTLDVNEIRQILPHRYPFLLIDRVLEMESKKRIVAIKNVTANEPHFTGHFPDYPIMPGVLMIDDNWMEANGTWRFHPGRFPRPAEMIDQLHKLGFKLMLWTCPLVSPDTQNFRLLQQRGCVVFT